MAQTRRSLIFILLLLALAGLFFVVWRERRAEDGLRTERAEGFSVVARNMEIPWGLAFLPDGELLVTLRSGVVLHVESGRTFPVQGVEHAGEGGLLGIALDPGFADNDFVYLYQTTEAGDGLENRVVRYRYDGEMLAFDRVILSGIPGSRFHDGGRIAFGPDGMLYVSTGDAGTEDSAEDLTSLAGKILRMNPDGSVPSGNPFGTLVYSYGHRNVQGLAWDASGRLWATDHGRSGVRSGYDEINLIEPGANYGWPGSEGDTVLPDTVGPVRHSGANETWAPASAAFFGNSLFFGGLRGEALYEAVIDGTSVSEIREHFKNEFGRVRTVTLGPDGFLYITTSNRDGRGSVSEGDDMIIRIDPEDL